MESDGQRKIKGEEVKQALAKMQEETDDAKVKSFLQRLRSMVDDGSHHETLELHVNVKGTCIGPDGVIKSVREVHNVICTVGKNLVLLHTGGSLLSAFNYAGLGTNTTAANIADTALGTELSGGSYARQAAVLTNPTAASLLFTATFSPGVGTGAITEGGQFDASSAGHILTHEVWSVQNVASGDTYILATTIS